MNSKKIFITGSGGFVGRNLAEYFDQKSEKGTVFAPEKDEVDLLDSDAVKKYLNENKFDLVIHCATVGGTRKTGYDAGSSDVVSCNLRMFLNLARCLTPGMRMINMGSGAEYDHRAYTPKMKEDYFDINVPADQYGFSKYAISKYVEKTDNILSLRMFGLFGKYEDYTFKFISNAIVKNLLGLPIVINQNVSFDYLYISDFVQVIERLADHAPKYRHYNVTPTLSIDLLSIAKIINQAGGAQSEIRVVNPGFNREYTGDNARLLSEFPDLRFTAYSDAIKELYSYYKDNIGKLDLAVVKADPYIKNCRTV